MGAEADTAGDSEWTGDGERRERVWTVFLGVALAVGGAAMGYALAGVVAVSLVSLGVSLERIVIAIPTLSVAQQVGFVVVVLGYIATSERPGLLRISVPTRRDLAAAVVGLVVLLGAAMAITALLTHLEIQAAQNYIEQIGRENPRVMLYMVPIAIVVIGPAEELLFRGAIQGRLREVWGPVVAIGLASTVFAVAHVAALGDADTTARAVTIAALLVLSLILGVLYEYTENLVVPALVHGLYDAILFVTIYVTATA